MFIDNFAGSSVLFEVRSGRYDYVFHQAAVPRVPYSVEHPAYTTEHNLAYTVQLMEACKQGGVKRFIFASSSSVYGGAKIMPTPEDYPKNPVSPYAMQKHHVEEYCKLFNKLYGFDSVCLRYFNCFGPNQYGDSAYSTAISAWCHAIKHGTPLRSDGDGEQSRDMCYVDNVVDANILAAIHPGEFGGETFNVACQERTSNNVILEWFKNRFGDLEIVNAPERPGDVKHTCALIKKSKEILGYTPKVNIWEGLEKTIEWWGLNR
jgi:nucleoside-diphosphate-sugar epimerase